MPLPKGFKRSTPEIKHAICTELNNCIEQLPSTTCTEMKQDILSCTEFANYLASPLPEMKDIKQVICTELVNCLDALPSNIRREMVRYLSSSPELMTELRAFLSPSISTVSSDTEDIEKAIYRELGKYLESSSSTTRTEMVKYLSSCAEIMNYLSSPSPTVSYDTEAFRQAICIELVKHVNSPPPTTREEMAASLLLQTELMRHLAPPSRTTPCSTTKTTKPSKTVVLPSEDRPEAMEASSAHCSQENLQRVEQSEEVNARTQEDQETEALLELELGRTKESKSPVQIWMQCARKRAQSPPQHHYNQNPKCQGRRVDRYRREQPNPNDTQSQIWGARARSQSPPQNNQQHISRVAMVH